MTTAVATTTTAVAPPMTAIARSDSSLPPSAEKKPDSAASDANAKDNKAADIRSSGKKAKNKTNKPRRPLNAYNFFFSYMRVRFLQLSENGDNAASGQRQLPPVPSNLTASDIQSVLDSGPCLIGSPNRRRHRKSHGKISFKELTQVVSSGWKTLTDDTKRAFQEVAAEHRAKQFTPEEEEAAYKRGARRVRDRKRKEAATGAADAVRAVDNGAEHSSGGSRKKARRNSAPVMVVNGSSSTTNNITSQAVADNNETFHSRSMGRRSSAPVLAASSASVLLLSDQERQQLLAAFLDDEEEEVDTAAEEPHKNEANVQSDEFFSVIEPLLPSATSEDGPAKDAVNNNSMMEVVDSSSPSILSTTPQPTATLASALQLLPKAAQAANVPIPSQSWPVKIDNCCPNCQRPFMGSSGAFVTPPLSPTETAGTADAHVVVADTPLLPQVLDFQQPRTHQTLSPSSFSFTPPRPQQQRYVRSITSLPPAAPSFAGRHPMHDNALFKMAAEAVEEDKSWLMDIASPHDDDEGGDDVDDDIVGALCRMYDADREAQNWLELVANA